MKWPGHTPVDKVIDDTWLSSVDLVPAFLEAAGIDIPRILQADGASAINALHGCQFKRGNPMMWEWRNADCSGNDESITGWPMLGIRHEEFILLLNPQTRQRAL